ncbi:MAG TPA: hypothetical protein VFU47_14540, partial [Armatimonadota bacterium]|nr:hypothetical protein [Armatimonadota bacterium]
MRIRIVPAALWAVLVITAAIGTGASAAPPSPQHLFPRDERLSAAVTVTHGRVYLGELLEELSKSAKVPLEVEQGKGPVDGIGLVAFVQEVPLREVMSGLETLFSHRFDRWEWQRAPGGREGYILRHQRSPEEASVLAQQAMQARWARDVQDAYDIARLP